jgi:hypothetical protein
MKRLSWKYIAGLFDGEGTIDFHKTLRHPESEGFNLSLRIRVTLTEKSRFVLDSLFASFGGHLEFRDKAKIYSDHPNWQPAVTWNLSGSRAYGLLQNIVQHLQIKQNQARFGMAYYSNAYDRTIKGKHLSDEERAIILKFRQAVYNEMKAMKQDPQRLSDLAQIYKSVMR